MKKLISYLLLVIISIGANAQTSLETAVLTELNLYRSRLSNTQWKPKNADSDYDSNVGVLCKLVQDKDLANIAKYHSEYLSKVSKLGLRNSSHEKAHDENIDIKDWVELSYDQRAVKINRTNSNKELVSEIQIQEFSAAKGTSDKELAKIIISAFDRSDAHKESMILQFEEDIVIPIVGISVAVREGQDSTKLYYSVVIDLGIIQK